MLDEEVGRAAADLGLTKHCLKHATPFAITSSNQYQEIDGAPEPVRIYPWGTCRIDNLLHSKFRLIK